MKLQDVIDAINSTYENRRQEGASEDEACRCAIRLAAHIYDAFAPEEGLKISKRDAMGLALSISVLLERSKPHAESDRLLQMALTTIGQFYSAVRDVALGVSD